MISIATRAFGRLSATMVGASPKEENNFLRHRDIRLVASDFASSAGSNKH